MAKANQFLIPRAELSALLDAAATSPQKATIDLWYKLANKILIEWDGRGHEFFEALTPGQRWLAYSAEIHRGLDDLPSLISYRPDLAMRAAATFEALGADEYADAWRKLETKFPNKRFPSDDAQ